MKKKLLLLFVALIMPLLFAFLTNNNRFEKFHADKVEGINSSTNPPISRTGAPGEANCTACHSGAVQSATGTVDFSFSSADYLPGMTYDITISTASGPKNGFQMTILDDTNAKAGSFTAGTGSGVASSSSREYIRHTSSVGVTSWTFQWTAPSSDVGNLTAYYAFAKSNQNGSTSGETVYLGQATIPVSATAEISEYEKIDKDVLVFIKENELNVAYKLSNSSRTVIQIIDLSGKLIYERQLGIQSNGKYMEQISFDELGISGIYIVSLFQNNLVFNRKVLIP